MTGRPFTCRASLLWLVSPVRQRPSNPPAPLPEAPAVAQGSRAVVRPFGCLRGSSSRWSHFMAPNSARSFSCSRAATAIGRDPPAAAANRTCSRLLTTTPHLGSTPERSPVPASRVGPVPRESTRVPWRCSQGNDLSATCLVLVRYLVLEFVVIPSRLERSDVGKGLLRRKRRRKG